MAMTYSDLYWLARSVGLSHDQARIAAAVAMAESGGRPTALGDRGTSYGLWQVHTPAHPWTRGMNLFDPRQNALAMARISAGGTNWKPWTVYRTGAYLRYMNQPIGPPTGSWDFGAGTPTAIFTGGIQSSSTRQLRLPSGRAMTSPLSLDVLARAKHIGLL